MTHLKTVIWTNTNYPTFGMKCCRTCQLSIYSNPQSNIPQALLSAQHRGAQSYISSVGKYVP